MTRHRTTHPLLGTALVAVALLMAGCAHSANGGAGRWHGSFKDSCRDASVDGNGNLRASCRNAQGRWERAYLAERSCPSHRAGNQDGRLVCEGSGFGGSGGSGGGSQVKWRGSFDDSCRDIDVDRSGNLRASCRNAQGRWERAFLAERSCPSHRAANRDGRLVCEGSGFGGSGGSGGNAHVSWRGPFRDACRDIEVDRKGNLLASCPTTDNRWPRSYLPERTCPSHRAANQDGTLVCVP